ncbi:hypothetical protein PFISCL1PPCAC_198, partial [Pristionchus fissidentatus]
RMSALTALSIDILRASAAFDENHVFSPLALGCALVTAHDGAAGDTKVELTRLLGKDLPADRVSAFYASLTAGLTASSDKKEKNPLAVLTRLLANMNLKEREAESAVTATIFTHLFVDIPYTKCAIKTEYAKHVEEQYGAEIESIDFGQGVKAARDVNGLVEKHTRGRITKVVDEGAFSESGLVLASVVHFKGSWEWPFKVKNTRARPFHGVSGERIAEFMSDDDFYTRYFVSPELTVVSIGYEDKAYSMAVLMPSGDFGQWRAGLTAGSLETVLNNQKDGKVELWLPKWAVEATTEAKTVLNKCGVNRIFSRKDADLSVMSEADLPLCVANIVHKAVIEVDERGTEAAAAAIADFIVLCPPFDVLVFDRPFLYLIMKGSTVLFMGQHVL